MDFFDELRRSWIVSLSHHDNFFRFVQIKIQSAKHVGKAKRLAFHGIVVGMEDLFRSFQVILCSGQMVKAQQELSGHGVS